LKINDNNRILKLLPADFYKFAPSQQSEILRILNFLSSHSEITGVLWVGAASKGEIDDYSDVDFLCFIENEAAQIFKSRIIDKIKTSLKVQLVLDQGYLPWFGHLFSIFYKTNSLFTIDIGLMETDKLANFSIEPSFHVLWDKNKLMKHAHKGYYPLSNLKDPYSDIFLQLFKIRKNLVRGYLWNSIEYINRARRALMLILRKSVPKAKNISGRVDKNIEEVLDPATLEKLNETQPKVLSKDIALCSILIGKWALEETHNYSLNPAIEKGLRSLIDWMSNFVQTK